MKRTQAKRSAVKAANVSKLVDDLVVAISLNECAQRSLSDQDIGAPEQITLGCARKLLWRVHDAIETLAI